MTSLSDYLMQVMLTVVPVVGELGRLPVHDVQPGIEAARTGLGIPSKPSNPIVNSVETLQIVLV